MDNHIIQAKGRFHLKKKPGLLAVAVQQVEFPLRKHYRQGNARQTGTGAHVNKALPGQVRRNGQAVQ